MKELSAAVFSRLTTKEKECYLNQLLIEQSTTGDDNILISDDEHWFPQPEESGQGSEVSDVEDIVEDRVSETEDQEYGKNVDKASGSQTPFIAKDKSIWSRIPPTQQQLLTCNIFREKNSPYQSTEMLSISNTFKCIVTNEMVNIIIRHTNQKATTVYNEYNQKHCTRKQLAWIHLTPRDVYAFLGILITAGVNNSNTDQTSDMWKTSANPLYRATMGINRFSGILRFIRFDDANTRANRVKEDKAAAIRDIWTMLNTNLAMLYKRTQCLTIDEQLFPYSARTKLTQYIPSKPAKYGIKVWWICDAETSYPLTGHLYTGNPTSPEKCEDKEVQDLAVAMLTTMHSDTTTSEASEEKKPEIIGANTMEEMLGQYTTRRQSTRWPLAFFYNILDIASLEAYILYYENNKTIAKQTNQRRIFLRQLGEELCFPAIEERSQNPQIIRHFGTKLGIESMLGRPVNVPSDNATASGSTCKLDATGRKVVVGSCHICYKGALKKRRKTRKACGDCNKPVCDEHAITLVKCKECPIK